MQLAKLLATDQAEGTLDDLPTELKIQDSYRFPVGDGLKSLVLPSPSYHRSYLAARQALLQCLVK